jgi:hypothetical protein
MMRVGGLEVNRHLVPSYLAHALTSISLQGGAAPKRKPLRLASTFDLVRSAGGHGLNRNASFVRRVVRDDVGTSVAREKSQLEHYIAQHLKYPEPFPFVFGEVVTMTIQRRVVRRGIAA